jgi:hypothetical protein
MPRHTALPRQWEPFDFPHGASRRNITKPASQAGRRRFDSGRPLQWPSGVTARAVAPDATARLPDWQSAVPDRLETYTHHVQYSAGSSWDAPPTRRRWLRRVDEPLARARPRCCLAHGVTPRSGQMPGVPSSLNPRVRLCSSPSAYPRLASTIASGLRPCTYATSRTPRTARSRSAGTFSGPGDGPAPGAG